MSQRKQQEDFYCCPPSELTRAPSLLKVLIPA